MTTWVEHRYRIAMVVSGALALLQLLDLFTVWVACSCGEEKRGTDGRGSVEFTKSWNAFS